MMKQNNKAKW